MSSQRPDKIKIFLGYILICLIWGTTWLAIKVSIFSLPPFFSAGLRFTLASVLILVVLKFRKYKYHFDFKQTIFLLLVGLGSFSVPYGLVYWAEGRITSGLTAVTFAVMPFFAAILSKFFLKTNDLSFWKVFGILLGFSGLIVIFWGDLNVGSIDTAEGILAVVVSSFFNALVAVNVKKYGKDIDPIFINLIPMALGAVTLLLTSVFIESWSSLKFDLPTITAILYLAVFGSVVAFAIYFYLLKHISVVLLSMTSFITPVLAIFSGAVFLSEKFPSGTLIGAGLILMGILFINLYGEREVKLEEQTKESGEISTK
ncbi:MAG: EamA family transporter [Bacteroidetes bacterium]|nr:EamA family transporter [Bacteroidota bacterium]MCL5737746.1 EamA family transporter [Bacteroidota bacterium]